MQNRTPSQVCLTYHFEISPNLVQLLSKAKRNLQNDLKITHSPLIDPSNKHRINGRVAIFLKEGAFEGVRIQFVQEAIR